MTEEVDTGLMIMEDEQVAEERDGQRKGNPLGEQTTVIMTCEEIVKAATPSKEKGEEALSLSELGNSPLGSFQLLKSSQSSEGHNIIPYAPPLEEVRVLWFEDTLSEEDHKNFDLIYESLLLEGRAGNLTDLTLEMLLAETLLTWLQVMHERLKNLIISSEKVQREKEGCI